MAAQERVAITGLGAITPQGGSVAQMWQGMAAGVPGVSRLPEAWAADLPVQIGGTVPAGFEDRLSVREQRRLDRVEQFALLAGREAWADAGEPEVDPVRLAVVVGTGIGGLTTTLEQEHVRLESGPRRVSPHTVTMLMSNGSAAWLSMDIGAKAGARTAVSACASGSEAIALGREMILAGSADVVLVGGAEACIAPLTVAAFAQMRAMSKRNDDPAAASRPFDADRDGFVLGEGAAMLVLEREAFAKARGATVHGFVDGAMVSSDALDIVAADPQNQARTISAALRSAGVEAQDVGFIHAHATSTPLGDQNEIIAIAESIGKAVPVTSTKSMTGHLLGASGALSSVAVLCAMRDGVIPPTTNLDRLDPEIDADVVTSLRQVQNRVAVVNAFGFGGHNATLVFRRD